LTNWLNNLLYVFKKIWQLMFGTITSPVSKIIDTADTAL